MGESGTHGSGRQFELVAAVVQAWSAYRRHRDTAHRARLWHLVRELEHATADSAYTRLRETLTTVADFGALLGTGELAMEDRRRGDLLFARLVESAFATLPRQDVRPDPVRHVVLASDDPALWLELAAPLRYFGYRLHRAANATALGDALQYGPDALVLDWRARNSPLRADMLHGAHRPAAMVVLGTGEVCNRLAAVRIGADAYLRAPLEPDRLLEALQSVLAAEQAEPWRVVLLAEHQSDAAVAERALVDAGMEVATLSDPASLLSGLEDHPADLVMLFGTRLPGCRARELTAVVRQLPAHAGLPVMCVGIPEECVADHLAAGADAVLGRRTAIAALVRHAAIRAEQGRALRRHMTADPLTGLLNHARLKQELERELALRQRSGGRFTLAMVDLDCFKAINDTYGHPAGDRVIKALARLFGERLRRTDIAGRWGGEEFAVIFPDVGASRAGAVVERLRARFARLEFAAAGRRFSVTFSAGIAEYPADAGDPGALAMQADQALYSAKAAGRNCLVFAGADAAYSEAAQRRRVPRRG